MGYGKRMPGICGTDTADHDESSSDKSKGLIVAIEPIEETKL